MHNPITILPLQRVLSTAASVHVSNSSVVDEVLIFMLGPQTFMYTENHITFL